MIGWPQAEMRRRLQRSGKLNSFSSPRTLSFSSVPADSSDVISHSSHWSHRRAAGNVLICNGSPKTCKRTCVHTCTIAGVPPQFRLNEQISATQRTGNERITSVRTMFKTERCSFLGEAMPARICSLTHSIATKDGGKKMESAGNIYHHRYRPKPVVFVCETVSSRAQCCLP